MTIEYIGANATDGVCVGQSASAKVGFFGTAPIAKRATVTDAVVAHALNSTFSDTEAEAALDALGVKINAILATLEAYGLHATS